MILEKVLYLTHSFCIYLDLNNNQIKIELVLILLLLLQLRHVCGESWISRYLLDL